ncbi:MAG TPA: type I restriction enzyme HsdR N-terminal domain-containing protein [Flavisolibacter sp.]|nr:type I restriction enzyme HsdR N-terminal domain-containing protein [Flavisolibacter sp.]
MITVQYPEPRFRTKIEAGKRYVFDEIRKAWLLLTEEEWVRQNFVQYLIRHLNYPAASIALEKEIRVNGLRKRFDILVYDDHFQPLLLVECKAPNVQLQEAVLQQALRYHMTVPVSYIIITNGSFTLGWHRSGGELELMNEIPGYGSDPFQRPKGIEEDKDRSPHQ